MRRFEEEGSISNLLMLHGALDWRECGTLKSKKVNINTQCPTLKFTAVCILSHLPSLSLSFSPLFLFSLCTIVRFICDKFESTLKLLIFISWLCVWPLDWILSYSYQFIWFSWIFLIRVYQPQINDSVSTFIIFIPLKFFLLILSNCPEPLVNIK